MNLTFLNSIDYEKARYSDRAARRYEADEIELGEVIQQHDHILELFEAEFSAFEPSELYVYDTFPRTDCILVEISEAVLTRSLIERFLDFLRVNAPEFAISGRLDFKFENQTASHALFFVNLREIVVQDVGREVWQKQIGPHWC